MTQHLLLVALPLYGMALLLCLSTVGCDGTRRERAARVLLLVGLAFNAAALVARGIQERHPPFSNSYESLAFFAFTLALMSVTFERAFRARRLAIAPVTTAVVMLCIALFHVGPAHVPLMPALRTVRPQVAAVFYIHVSSYFVGYAALAVAFNAAVIDLLSLLFGKKDAAAAKAPSARTLDYATVAYRMVAFGFPFLTVGLVFGSLWARTAWSRYWGWDPKETWSLISWLVYLIYLHLPWLLPRLSPGLQIRSRKGRIIRTVALFVGFAVVLFTFLGVEYLPSALESLHAY